MPVFYLSAHRAHSLQARETHPHAALVSWGWAQAGAWGQWAATAAASALLWNPQSETGLTNAYGVPLVECPYNKPGLWMTVDKLKVLVSSAPPQTSHELVAGI